MMILGGPVAAALAVKAARTSLENVATLLSVLKARLATAAGGGGGGCRRPEPGEHQGGRGRLQPSWPRGR